MFLLTLVAFIVVLSVLVLIHEFGHFLTAKKFGIKVEEFGFGFPPRVFGKKIGETLYSINLLPIGGFVKLYGEDEAGGGSIKVKHPSESSFPDIKRAFFARPPWQKAIVILAGVVMNFILAVVVISYIFSGPGVPIPKGYAEVQGTLPNSPAAAINLRKGDRIVSFNNQSVKTVSDLRGLLDDNKDKKGRLVVLREGGNITFEVAPQKSIENGQPVYLIGVELKDFDVKKYPWYSAPFFGTIEVFKFSWMILTSLGSAATNFASRGEVPKDVAGPIGVFQLVGEAIKQGVLPLLWLTAVLSLNLAVINILPIPALDGGRLFFILIELVTRRKVAPKYETMAHAIGLAVLLCLILLITIYDISRILTGQSLLPKM